MPVVLESLKLSNLAKLDPYVESLFLKHLAHIVADMNNRPGDRGVRELSLKLRFTPVPETNPDTGITDCTHARMTASASSSVPKFLTREVELLVGKTGLRFNVDAPDAVDQGVLWPSAGESGETGE